MKNILPLLILILFLGCQSKNDDEIISFLNQKIDNWHDAASKGNFDNYFNFIANDGIFIGTDISERWTKKNLQTSRNPILKKVKHGHFLLKNVLFV
ncbi:MAG: hypothetical protein CM15mP23_12650 [Cryomorphaceae bacterium]|nr:MAG: hypothetical protein CM15mP23_12650 [Cryomorphaceae bacterium]